GRTSGSYATEARVRGELSRKLREALLEDTADAPLRRRYLRFRTDELKAKDARGVDVLWPGVAVRRPRASAGEEPHAPPCRRAGPAPAVCCRRPSVSAPASVPPRRGAARGPVRPPLASRHQGATRAVRPAHHLPRGGVVRLARFGLAVMRRAPVRSSFGRD